MRIWLRASIAAVAAVGLSCFAAPADADVIAATNVGRVIDGNGDDIGDSGFGNAGSVAIGEPGNLAENNEGRFITYFNPSAAERAVIAAATSITLDVVLDRTGATSPANLEPFEVDLLGFEDVTFSGIAGSMYHQTATLLHSGAFTSADASPSNTDLLRSFDVTSFVKTEAARSGTSSIAFRFEVDPATLPILDGKQVFWVLEGMDSTGTPTLTTTAIPEPAAAALLALGVAGLIRRPQ